MEAENKQAKPGKEKNSEDIPDKEMKQKGLFRANSEPMNKSRSETASKENKRPTKETLCTRTNSESHLSNISVEDLDNTSILQLSVLELIPDSESLAESTKKTSHSHGWVNSHTDPANYLPKCSTAEGTSEGVSLAEQIAVLPINSTSSAGPAFSRQLSWSSVGTSKSDGRATCRICWDVESTANPLVAPCQCSGSSAYVHVLCLEKWLTAAGIRRCEVCRHPFKIKRVLKPIREWHWFPTESKPRTQLWITLIIMFIVTPPVACGLILCVEKLGESLEHPDNVWKMAGLVFLGLISLCLYLLLMAFCCCKTCVVWKLWVTSNQTIAIRRDSQEQAESHQQPPV